MTCDDAPCRYADCANVQHAEGVHGPNWPAGGYAHLGWCGEEECSTQPCPNAEVCRETSWPLWLMDCHGGRCLNCNCHFGRDLAFDNIADECPVCYEENVRKVKMPFCTHRLCVPCFRRMFAPLELVEDCGWTVNIEADLKCPLCRETAPKYPWSTEKGVGTRAI